MSRLVRMKEAPQQASMVYSLKSAAEIYQTEWKLTTAEQENLSHFALRKWSITELLDMITLVPGTNDLQVRLWNVVYLATLQCRPETIQMLRYMVTREKSWRDPINDKQPKFWLSFRSGTLDTEPFAYVIVQESRES